ncbi:hypothetical protein [Marinobacterium litorale]|uniref:hypothetical protein n=1 Tax=Marinobacterium litorale TaxID=404770 RepID=UPI0004150FAD|nr:hypothetical protein [Marinobacterium litorale]
MDKQRTLSSQAVNILRWLRDNKHHYGSWEPQDNYPDVTHMELRGHDTSATIPVEVNTELQGLVRFDIKDHLFYPTDEALEMIND